MAISENQMSEVKLKLDRVVKKRPVRQNERVEEITVLKTISMWQNQQKLDNIKIVDKDMRVTPYRLCFQTTESYYHSEFLTSLVRYCFLNRSNRCSNFLQGSFRRF